MRAVLTLMRRELAYYLRSPMGYLIIAVTLVIDGLLFNAWAIGTAERKSSEVLEIFFYCASGTTLLASVFISMRLIAEERQNGTLVLLLTSPLKDYQLVLGKYLSALAFLAILTLITLYMPALVMIRGKISVGHIVSGYLGLLLLGGTTIALGLLCSSFSPNQLTAAILSAAVITTFILLWLLSRIASPPVEEVLAYLAIHDKHFKPFMRGLISIQDVIFYLSLTYVALLLATRSLESRRWHS